MSMPTILPTGQLHPDLFNGPFVKHISSTPAAAGEPGAKVHGGAIAERRTQMEERVNKAWRENRDNVIDLSGHFNYQTKDIYDGKTVVENKGMGLIVETDRKSTRLNSSH